MHINYMHTKSHTFFNFTYACPKHKNEHSHLQKLQIDLKEA